MIEERYDAHMHAQRQTHTHSTHPHTHTHTHQASFNGHRISQPCSLEQSLGIGHSPVLMRDGVYNSIEKSGNEHYQPSYPVFLLTRGRYSLVISSNL